MSSQPHPATTTNDPVKASCCWQKAKPENIQQYQVTTRNLLNQVHIPTAALTCTDSRCTDVNHTHSLDTMYNDVCEVLYSASISCIPSSKCDLASQYVIPGWNDYVQEAHREARYAYITWRDFGKPRKGPVCELMKGTRALFKYRLRQCQTMEETARADEVARSLT